MREAAEKYALISNLKITFPMLGLRLRLKVSSLIIPSPALLLDESETELHLLGVLYYEKYRSFGIK